MSNIFVLGLVSLLTDIGSEMIYPLIPTFLIATLGAAPVLLGLIEGVAESVGSLFKIFFGYFSDKLKKRKLFAGLGYSTSTVGKVVLVLATNWVGVFIARLIDRFGKAVRTAPRDALIVESAKKNKKGAAFGLHRAMDTAGAIIGIIIAFLILQKFTGDIRLVFYWSLVPATLAVLVLAFFVRERRPESLPIATEPEKISFNWALLPRQLKIFLIITFIFALGNSSNLFLILKALDIGFLPLSVLMLYLSYNISYFLFLYPASRYSDKVGRRGILVAGYFLYGLVYLLFAFIQVELLYWLLFVIYGIYMGMTEGVEKALVADNSPAELKATALGMHAAIVGVTLFPASLLAGIFWQYFGSSTPFYLSAFTGFITSILVLKYIK